MRMLWGLMSRWMIPWAWAYARPSAIPWTICTAFQTGRGFVTSSSDPGTYSISTYGTGRMFTSSTSTILGWRSVCHAAISLRKHFPVTSVETDGELDCHQPVVRLAVGGKDIGHAAAPDMPYIRVFPLEFRREICLGCGRGGNRLFSRGRLLSPGLPGPSVHPRFPGDGPGGAA